MSTSTNRVPIRWMKRLLSHNANVGEVLASAKRLGAADLDELLHRTGRLTAVKPWTAGGGYPSLSELGTYSNFPPRVDLEAEFNWAIAVLKLHSDRLSRLLKQKEDFETLLLSDKLDLARVTLDAAIRDHGWSLWAIEAKLLVAQLTDGSDSCQRELTQILDQCTSVSVRLFAIFAAVRIEESIPVEQHDRQVAATIATLKDGHEDDEEYSSYYEFLEAVINLPAASQWTRESLAFALHGHQLFSALDWSLFTLTALQAAVANPDLAAERQLLLRNVQRFAALAAVRAVSDRAGGILSPRRRRGPLPARASYPAVAPKSDPRAVARAATPCASDYFLSRAEAPRK